MLRALAILQLLAYTFAAIALPLAFALQVQQNTPATFVYLCSCGCAGDPQKCTCHEAGNTVTFTPCGAGQNHILVPDTNISIAPGDLPGAEISVALHAVPLSLPTVEATLPGVDNRIEHPPRA
jgi:hypothetical protein